MSRIPDGTADSHNDTKGDGCDSGYDKIGLSVGFEMTVPDAVFQTGTAEIDRQDHEDDPLTGNVFEIETENKLFYDQCNEQCPEGKPAAVMLDLENDLFLPFIQLITLVHKNPPKIDHSG